MNRSILAVLPLIWACGINRGAPTLRGFATFFSIDLQWTHPVGEAEGGYAIEMRPVPEPFQVVQSVPFTNLHAFLPYPSGTPEATDFEFRVRALPDDDGSRASNVVSTHRGLASPTLSCQPQFTNGCAPTNGAFHLSLANHSVAADSIELKRTVFVQNSAQSSTMLPVTLTTTSYDDGDLSAWVHGAYFVYSLTVLKGTERSFTVTTSTLNAPP